MHNLPVWFFSFLLSAYSSISLANTATCSIEIEDINKGSIYKLEHRFNFEKGDNPQTKYFETPGNDYKCSLIFFGMKNGSALACEYKKDKGRTYFQSDRSTLRDSKITNNLLFRHRSAFLSLKTKCN